ncbi:RHS repeat-associated core domain-containing protein [Amycolatopsis pretoriensis]|uniref:RHS repeat-associated core domain-containing protein n=1 Tax=Amycolatopsis pretoriensis TaxID=218821 RepID=UPI001FC98ECA|nr:RHS repeat-associated core domain-containing protein [Amycolatopsis pretoriensis]
MKDSTTAYSGVSLLESAADLKSAIESGDWASVAMGAVGTALDALSMAMDPFGAILAAGVGWLIEHVGPLKEALNALTGNADEIAAQSETWTNVAKELGSVGEDLTGMVKADTTSWTGNAGDTYRQRAQDTVTLLETAQKGCEGASSGVKTAGEVVAAVRALVRDIIAELVGHLISWALQVVFTLGIGLTWVVPQVVGAVAKTASKLADLMKRLVTALKALIPLLKRAGDLFGDAAKALKNIKPGKAAPTPKHADINGSPKGLDGPKGKGGDSTSTTGDHSGGSPNGHKNDPPGSTGDKGNGSPGNGDSTGPAGAPNKGPDNSGRGGNGSRGNPDDTKPQGIRGQGENNRSLGNEVCVTDPVAVSTGQMVMEEVDASLLGVLPLVFRRTHFSGYRAGLFLGGSWVSTVDQRIEADELGVSFAAEDGTLLRYPRPGTDDWVVAESGPLRPLKRAPDGGYLVDDQELGRLLYFAPGAGRALLTSVTDRNDNAFEIVRAEDGRPLEIRHTAGHRVRFETVGGLITALFAVTGDGEVELVRYGYDRRNLVTVTNPSGQPMTYTYDRAGRIVGWTDRNDEWFRYHYDHAGRVVRTEGSGGFLDCVLEYDPDNRVTRTTDALGHTSEFHYNEAGQVVREVDPLGRVTLSEWDARDNLLSSTDPLGRTTRYRYDELGNLLAQIRPDGAERTWERAADGRSLVRHDAPGVATRNEFDERGNLVTVVAPDGAITRYQHDERGVVVAVTDATGATATVVNDAAGLPVEVTDQRGVVTRYERDEFGRIVAIADAAGGVERVAYSVDGNLVRHQDADGNENRWVLDGEGNDRVHTGASGGVTRYEYGGFDQVTAQILATGDRISVTYDGELRIATVTNQQGRVWRYERDATGNVVRETDFAGGVTTLGYDAAGQLVERVRPDGQRTTFRYDLAGHLVEQNDGNRTTRFEVSATGQLMSADDGTTRISYERDAVGRVLAETVNGRTVRSAYDAEGRRVSRLTPSGAESAWEYDPAGLPAAARLAGRELRFTHDAAGREVRRTLGTGATLTQTWTPNSLLASQVITDGAKATRQQRSYRYRADGELVSLLDQASGPREFTLDPLGRITEVRSPHGPESYRYDEAGNVTDASWPTAEPDLAGRRTFVGPLVTAAGGTRYGHDRRGRVVLRERTMPGGAKLAWRFTWDGDDRLVAAAVPDGSTWRYTYDALGRRVAKEHLAADGRTALERVEFTWDGQLLVEEARHTPDGVQATVWDYEPGDYRPLAQRGRVARPGQAWVDTRFDAIVADLVGSPAELVDDHGRITWCARTSAFGVGGPSATPLRFPGQYFDAETGLHYNAQRYYDPVTARYLSPDPLGLEPGPNPYAYVGNPFGQIDPLGLAPQSCGKPKLTLDTNIGNNPIMQSPGGGKYSQSPGGNWYKESAPAGPNKGKKNRPAAGMANPDWTHSNIRPMFENALTNKHEMPAGLTNEQKNQWMKTKGKFQTLKQDGTPDQIVPKKNAIMGHNKSAGTYFNETGHKLPIDANKHYNRQPSSYGQVEYSKSSSGTGSHEDKYIPPRPDRGSSSTYTNPAAPNYTGGPWSSYPQAPNGLPPGSQGVLPDGTPIPHAPTTERPGSGLPPVHTPPASPTGPPAKRPRLG